MVIKINNLINNEKYDDKVSAESFKKTKYEYYS